MDLERFKGKEEQVCIDANNMTSEDFCKKHKVKRFEIKELIEELHQII